MTHTIADAEAAIARHPECLETLSMAADLMIESGDPRGEDFAACLDGSLSAEEVMWRHPADVSAMYVAAWRMACEEDECPKCQEWNGVGQVPDDHNVRKTTWSTCPRCNGSGSNGKAARAEALRLLAECGKVGQSGFGYDCPVGHQEHPNYHMLAVPSGWWYATAVDTLHPSWTYPVQERFALLEAYAKADPDTRRRWAEETRALAAREVTP